MRTQAICLALVTVLICPFASAQWKKTNGPSGGELRSLAVSGTSLFAGIWGGGVFLLANDGTGWTAVNAGLTSPYVNALAVSGPNLFAGTYGGVFLSTDNGTSWTAVNSGLVDTLVIRLGVSGPNLFASTRDHGIFRSTNNGTSWAPANTPFSDFSQMVLLGENLVAGDYGVYLSTNNGTTWTRRSNTGIWPSAWVSILAVSGTNLFAGITGAGVYLSTDSGGSWTAASTGVDNPFVKGLAVSGTSVFQGGFHGGIGSDAGVWLSTNSGTSWTRVDTGLTDPFVKALVVSGANLFVGTDGGVWRRPLSEMVAAVESPTSELRREFMLRQNYPNPFNPSTTIKYDLPKSSMVRLSVYDILGREVSVLVDERRDAGYHEVRFDGSSLASGVYIYRLQAGNFVQAKRLLLLK